MRETGFVIALARIGASGDSRRAFGATRGGRVTRKFSRQCEQSRAEPRVSCRRLADEQRSERPAYRFGRLDSETERSDGRRWPAGIGAGSPSMPLRLGPSLHRSELHAAARPSSATRIHAPRSATRTSRTKPCRTPPSWSATSWATEMPARAPLPQRQNPPRITAKPSPPRLCLGRAAEMPAGQARSVRRSRAFSADLLCIRRSVHPAAT